MGSAAGGDDEHGLRVFGRHPLGGVLKLEAVGEDEVVALGGVGPECLSLLGWCAGFDMADLDAERISDATRRNACGRSITALPRTRSGARLD